MSPGSHPNQRGGWLPNFARGGSRDSGGRGGGGRGGRGRAYNVYY